MMLPQETTIVFNNKDFDPEEFDHLLNPIVSYDNPDKLWDAHWLAQFKGGRVALCYRDERFLVVTAGAAKCISNVAPEVVIVQLSDDIDEFAEKIESATPLPDALQLIENEDFGAMLDPMEDLLIHPAQDFTNETLYYGIQVNRKPFLLSSEHELLSFLQCGARNILLHNNELPEKRLSQKGLIGIVLDQITKTPDNLHEDIVKYIREFVYLREPAHYSMLAAWVIGTYVFRCFRFFPYLHINAEKGSGKTHLMEVIAPICFNGEILTNPTESSLLGLISRKLPTLFIDETEAMTKEHAGRKTELMSILKTGFSRNGRVIRSLHELPTYCPKAFSGINEIDDVLADRTITLRMIRKTQEEQVQPYLMTKELLSRQAQLRDDLYNFGVEEGPDLASTYENYGSIQTELSHLSNRAYDIWLPLVTIGKFCGAINPIIDASKLDAEIRRSRDNELNETATLLQGILEVVNLLKPVKQSGTIAYYDPELVQAILVKEDALPRSMTKKTLSRYLRQKLNIASEPTRNGIGLMRLYAIDQAKLNEYQRSYLTNDKQIKMV